MTKLHRGLVVVNGAVDTTQNTLVIPEEKNIKSGNALDCNQKTTLLQLMDDIIAGDSIHDGVEFKGADLLEYRPADRERECCALLAFKEQRRRNIFEENE